MTTRHRIAAIIPAAGKGERLGVGMAKALHRIGARSLLDLAARSLAAQHDIDVIVVAAPPEHIDEVLRELAFLADRGIVSKDAPESFVDDAGDLVQIDEVPERLAPGVIVVAGGASRQESVGNALAVLPHDIEYVLVHDAARALTPEVVIRNVMAALADGANAVIPVMPVTDTIKQVEDGAVMRTVDRGGLRAVQTPQGFTRAALERAHQHAQQHGIDDVTDDAGLCELAGIPVRVVDGDALAFKITRPLDLVLAEAILEGRT